MSETKEQLAHRYGRPSAYPSALASLLNAKEYHNALDEVCEFHPNDLNILAYFKHGKAVLLKYRKKDRSPMTDNELSSLLGTGTKKSHWIVIPGDEKSDLRWRTSDSSVFAYYYRELQYRSIYEAPRYLLMVQTASVNAIYKKNVREWYRGIAE
jgi:hypothetical protein